MNPLVTIIVPSFNQGHFIKETLDSILSQDYRPIEILVLDGGSTDQTVSILESYNGTPEVTWWSQPDKGVVDAVNTGLKRAAGEIAAIQSSDDLYLPAAIKAAVQFLTANPEIDLVYGDVELINERSEVIGRDILEPFDLKRYLGRFSYIPQPTAFFRTAIVKGIGGWRQEVSYAADADFWLRIAVNHNVARIDRIMARYRYHPEQRDAQKARISQDWERAITDLLESNSLDRSTRNFARMGIYLAKRRYSAESEWLRRSVYLYRAALANPAAVLNQQFPKRELIIGRDPIWKFLARIKRRLGFRPRTSLASR